MFLSVARDTETLDFFSADECETWPGEYFAGHWLLAPCAAACDRNGAALRLLGVPRRRRGSLWLAAGVSRCCFAGRRAVSRSTPAISVDGVASLNLSGGHGVSVDAGGDAP